MSNTNQTTSANAAMASKVRSFSLFSRSIAKPINVLDVPMPADLSTAYGANAQNAFSLRLPRKASLADQTSN